MKVKHLFGGVLAFVIFSLIVGLIVPNNGCAYAGDDWFHYNGKYIGSLNGVPGSGCDDQSVAYAFEHFNIAKPINYTCRYWMPTCQGRLLEISEVSP